MDKNINIMDIDDITSKEYRKNIEAQLAYDIWFMNDHSKNEWDEDFSWDSNCFPIEAGNGWLYSLYVLCTKLLTEVKSNFEVVQVKEKFGRARFYYSGGITPYGKQLIAEFEKESETICEHCGEPGKLRGTGWYMTLCDKCWEEYRK